jgi:hypothetical protein
MPIKDYVSVVGLALCGGYALSLLMSPQADADPPRSGLQGYFESRRGFHLLLAILAANFLLFAFNSWVVFALGVVAELVVTVVMLKLLNPTAEWVSFVLGIGGFGVAWLCLANPFGW